MNRDEELRQKMKELADAFAVLSDADMAKILQDDGINELFTALLPKPYDRSGTIYEYLLANKTRMTLAAGNRHAIMGRLHDVDLARGVLIGEWHHDDT